MDVFGGRIRRVTGTPPGRSAAAKLVAEGAEQLVGHGLLVGAGISA
jgi:hypothetical protein